MTTELVRLAIDPFFTVVEDEDSSSSDEVDAVVLSSSSPAEILLFDVVAVSLRAFPRSPFPDFATDVRASTNPSPPERVRIGTINKKGQIEKKWSFIVLFRFPSFFLSMLRCHYVVG